MEVSWLLTWTSKLSSWASVFQISFFEWALSSKCTGKLLLLFPFPWQSRLAELMSFYHIFILDCEREKRSLREKLEAAEAKYQSNEDVDRVSHVHTSKEAIRKVEGGLTWFDSQRCVDILTWTSMHYSRMTGRLTSAILLHIREDWTLWNQSLKSDGFLGGRSPRKMLWDVQQLPMKDGILTWLNIFPPRLWARALGRAFSPTTRELQS